MANFSNQKINNCFHDYGWNIVHEAEPYDNKDPTGLYLLILFRHLGADQNLWLPSWIGAWYIIADHDKSSFLAMFIMINNCLQWSIMEDNDLQRVAS